MSHVATVDLEIRDLDALAVACRRLGLELVRGQTTYHCWFSEHEKADWERVAEEYRFDTAKLMPSGFRFEEMGACEHAVRIAGDGVKRSGDEAAYEIGVVRRRDGRPGFQLLWDFYAGGHGLQAKVGEDCNKLRQAYGVEAARRQAIAGGFTVSELAQADGSVRLVLRK